KASSNAMTSSTVSSESAPRSSTKEALGVTSPSSTPSCSTIICFTLSSTAAAIGLRLLLRLCLIQIVITAVTALLISLSSGRNSPRPAQSLSFPRRRPVFRCQKSLPGPSLVLHDPVNLLQGWQQKKKYR